MEELSINANIQYWNLGKTTRAELTPSLTQAAGITQNSRSLQPGDIFVAMPGDRSNGVDYIAAAIAAGAAVIMLDQRQLATVKSLPNNITVIACNDIVGCMLQACHWLYPKVPEQTIMVTGTDGKSSSTVFCYQLLAALGHPVAVFGTLGLSSNADIATRLAADAIKVEALTTPMAPHLRKLAASLAAAGCSTFVMEASSHGLAQRRCDALTPQIAGLTHIAHDHLDYHGSFQAYFSSKLRLFTELLPVDGTAVLPLPLAQPQSAEWLSDQHAAHCEIHRRCNERGNNIISYSATENLPASDCSVRMLVTDASGTSFRCRCKTEEITVKLPLWGDFQAENLALAIGLAYGLEPDARRILAHLRFCRPAAGRMQLIASSTAGGRIFVDYAHSPGALARALLAAKAGMNSNNRAKLWLVFGCGGDRDQAKRPLMGEIALQHADTVIVTDDNPRTEDPALIRQAILAPASQHPDLAKKISEFPDRAQAIGYAIIKMRRGDTLLIAGKGHEQYQLIAEQQLSFDDCAIARDLANRHGWQALFE